MRNFVTRFAALLLAMALVFALSANVFAVESEPMISLNGPSRILHGNEISLTLDVAEAGVVADGKLTISYDPTAICFVEGTAGPAWAETDDLSLQINDGTAGKLVVAFAGVEAAAAGTILELQFTAAEGVIDAQTSVTLDPESSYITGVEEVPDAGVELDIHCPSARFTDVSAEAYYHAGVDYCVENGYMVGISDTEFGPKENSSRAMIVSILYRMAGSPQVTGELPFVDVTEDRYFYDAVLWAYQNGITAGVSATRFAPYSTVTRQDMVTLFARYAETLGASVEDYDNLSVFTDQDRISGYARESVSWAVYEEILHGTSDTTLSPKGSATRGQTAVIVVSFAAAIQD